MSERKVLQKYYPPDFDPSALSRSRRPKNAGAKYETVRLMAPFPMKCTSCGEYIYKGRKFNAKKVSTDTHYLGIKILSFHIRCTRCSGEIVFKTDPKNMDYTCVSGAKRNTEPWKMNGAGLQESDEERLNRLEAEEEERNAMVELETKTLDAKREMAVADALDEIRTRNARNERVGKHGSDATVERATFDEEREKQDREDEETARRAFATRQESIYESIYESIEDDGTEWEMVPTEAAGPSTAQVKEVSKEMPPPSFKRVVKKKQDFSAKLGIKRKPSLI